MLRLIQTGAGRPISTVDPNATFELGMLASPNPCGEIELGGDTMDPELEGLEDESVFDEPTEEFNCEELTVPKETSWTAVGGALLVSAALSLISKKKDL